MVAVVLVLVLGSVPVFEPAGGWRLAAAGAAARVMRPAIGARRTRGHGVPWDLVP
ncbi:MAG TPA: hypothetical protein VIU64_21860 [Polyangia bacterium]